MTDLDVGRVELSVLDVPYAQLLLFRAVDLLYAVESGDEERIMDAALTFRRMLDRHQGL